MIIQNVIAHLMGQPANNVVREMRNRLNRARGGNQLPHSTTGKTADSIKAEFPVVSSVMMTWDFKGNDSAARLNNGGSRFKRKTTDVPYGQFSDPGGESQYIKALIKWCGKKYGLDPAMAKKMAFAVAQSASERGTVVKNAGWFDEIESKVFRQIMSDIQSIIMVSINQEINTQLKI